MGYLKYVKKGRYHKLKFNTPFLNYHYKKAKEKLRTLEKMRDDDNKNMLEYDEEDLNLIQISNSEKNKIKFQIEQSYGNKYKILDIAKKIKTGVGSANLNRYYALVIKDNNNTILIEAKEQVEPSIKKSFALKENLKEEFEDKSCADIYIDAVKNMIDDYGKDSYSLRSRGI